MDKTDRTPAFDAYGAPAEMNRMLFIFRRCLNLWIFYHRQEENSKPYPQETCFFVGIIISFYGKLNEI